MGNSCIRLLGGFLAAAAVAGCGIQAPTPPSGLTLTASEVAFGPVLAGTSVTRKVTVSNTGGEAITLQDVRVLEGELGTAWTVEVPTAPLQPGGQAALVITFAPPLGAAAAEEALRLELPADGLADPSSVPGLRLTGTVITAVCDVPTELAFDRVPVGGDDARTFTLTNTLPVAVTTTVGAITSNSGGDVAFGVAVGSAGEVVLQPGASREVAVTFAPEQSLSYTAVLAVRASEGCPEQTVLLTGGGTDEALRWNPKNVDCGYVPPGLTVTRTVTFTNITQHDIALSNIKTQNAAEFGRVVAPGEDPSGLSVPAAGTVDLVVFCKPGALGPRQTMLSFDTSLPSQPAGQVALSVRGGGPDIEVTPSPLLDFGKVAYFAGINPPSFSKRRLTVRNVGTPPAAPDPRANLRLGGPDATGHPMQPYFTLSPLNAQTAAAEFQVTLPAHYDAQKGLVARPGEDSLSLEVTFTPISVGVKEAKLTVYSNDVDEPAVEISLRAEAVDAPICSYSLSAATLNFGRVIAPEQTALTLSVRNDGATAGETCFVYGPELTATSHAFFSLLEAPSAFELEPGEVRHFRVRARPEVPAPQASQFLIGAVEFFFSSPTQPRAQLQLGATWGDSCIAFAPNVVDMGAVPLGCGMRTQEVTVLNLCDQPVTLPAPTLAGSSAFSLAQLPAAVSLPEYGSATLSLTYAPTSEVTDHGTVMYTATEGGMNVTWALPLQGRGTQAAQATESFTVPSTPKTDLLMVLDPSCNAGYLAALADGVSSFLNGVVSTHTDLHVGVINAHVDSGTPPGQLLYGLTHPERFLTPGTSDFVNKLKTKIQMPPSGSTESCLQAAMIALTDPLVANGNAGFLRPDAHLAVLCLTDAPDRSAPSADWYLNRFLNLKGHTDRNAFSFSAIAGFDPAPPTGCMYDGGPDDGRLAQLVEKAHGVRMELCAYAADYSDFMADLGVFASRSRAPFFLKGTPDVSPGLSALTVAVDGVPVPDAQSGITHWTYDAAARVLTFSPPYHPGPGETVTVTYPATCAP